jgi:hypothetical protein
MHRTADIAFTVSLVELKSAFRRLSARPPDESEAGGKLVVFDASHNELDITANAQGAEGLPHLPSKAGLASRSCRLLAQLVLQQFVRKVTAREAETARRLRLGTAGRLQGALDQSLLHSRK